MNSEWDEGYSAAENGAPFWENPYSAFDSGTPLAFNAWLAGWCAYHNALVEKIRNGRS